MKIAISYPPLDSPKGSPFLSQNRQFQWTNTGNCIYPVIPASAATLLQSHGHRVFWDDAIVQKLSYRAWLDRLIKEKPDLVVIETKTPVIKRHWQIIKDLKQKSLEIGNWKLTVCLMGDHVSSLPQESIKNSPVDFVLAGGDYDFLIKKLVDLLSKDKKPTSKVVSIRPAHELDSLPIIDRKLTQWHLYARNNTNYRYKPGAHIMSGRDCWWGSCTFCSWTSFFPGKNFRRFSVAHTIAEIENLVNNFGVKEIFDDSGTLPVGQWLEDLCRQIIKKKLNQKVKFGCNMRFGALNQDQYYLLKKAGFRFVLYGLESANQKTLDLINKNEKTTDALQTLRMAKKAGLEPHVTVMIGYPWETENDAVKTLNLARKIFRDGLADTIQATRIIPYPGTPLFRQCLKNNWLLSKNWDDYDMRQSIIKSPISSQRQEKLIRSLFRSVLTPKFLIRKVLSIRSPTDVQFLAGYAFKYLQKIRDFG